MARDGGLPLRGADDLTEAEERSDGTATGLVARLML